MKNMNFRLIKFPLIFILLISVFGCSSNSIKPFSAYGDWSFSKFTSSTNSQPFLWLPTNGPTETIHLPSNWNSFLVNLRFDPGHGCVSYQSGYIATSNYTTQLPIQFDQNSTLYTSGVSSIIPNIRTSCNSGHKKLTKSVISDYLFLVAASETLLRKQKYFYITGVKNLGKIGALQSRDVVVLHSVGNSMQELLDWLNPNSNHWADYANQDIKHLLPIYLDLKNIQNPPKQYNAKKVKQYLLKKHNLSDKDLNQKR
jgi:hypothetical protein